METPQSLRDSSPTSGAKWLSLSCAFKYNEQVICRGDHWSSDLTICEYLWANINIFTPQTQKRATQSDSFY